MLNRIFREYRFIIIKILLIYREKFYKYYFNINYILLLIDKSFLNKFIEKEDLKIEIKKKLLIKIRDFNIENYNIYEYIIIFIYIFYKNSILILI